MTDRVLMVLTSHGVLGDSGAKTGFWWEELAEPWRVFAAAGLAVDLASPRGGRPPVDPGSVATESVPDPELDRRLAETMPLAAVRAGGYAATFLVGGHGTMWDFPDDARLAEIVGAVHRSGLVAAVCHGSAGLLGAVTEEGRPLVAGRTVAAFSDAEEAIVGADTVIPFSLERRLTALGATVDVGVPFGAQVRGDGRLITGQNPASSAAVAAAVVTVLSAAASR